MIIRVRNLVNGNGYQVTNNHFFTNTNTVSRCIYINIFFVCLEQQVTEIFRIVIHISDPLNETNFVVVQSLCNNQNSLSVSIRLAHWNDATKFEQNQQIFFFVNVKDPIWSGRTQIRVTSKSLASFFSLLLIVRSDLYSISNRHHLIYHCMVYFSLVP